jgi:tetratricopeptide (TPR) repeat protein
VLIESEGLRLRFVHDKIWEAAYASIPESERAAAHQRAARAIEARTPGPESYPALARHYRVALDFAKAFEFARRAGEEALRRGAFHQACEELGSAIELGRDAVALGDVELGRLLRLRADALYAIGETERMEECFHEAIRRLGVAALPDRRWAWRRMLVKETLRQIRLRLVRERPRTRKASAADADTAHVLERLGELYVYREQPLEYLASKLLAANLAERAGASDALAWVHVNLAVVLASLGVPRLSRGYLRTSRAHAASSSAFDTQLYQQQIEAFVCSMFCEWERAESMIARAIERCRAAGAAHRLEQLLVVASIVASSRGDFENGYRCAEEMGRSAEVASRALHAAFAHLMKGVALAGYRRALQALEELALAERSFEALQLSMHLANCRALKASMQLELGDRDGALASVYAARSCMTKPPVANPIARTYYRYAIEVFLALWAHEQSRGVEGPSRARALQLIREARIHAHLAPGSRSFVYRQRARAAWLEGKPARASALIERSVRVAELLRAPFELAVACLELAERDLLRPTADRRQALARANELFARLGCERWLAHVALVRRALEPQTSMRPDDAGSREGETSNESR